MGNFVGVESWRNGTEGTKIPHSASAATDLGGSGVRRLPDRYVGRQNKVEGRQAPAQPKELWGYRGLI